MFRKFRTGRKKVIFEARISSASTSMLLPLEPRCMYDAALGVEVMAAVHADAAVHAPDTDMINAASNTNTSVHDAVDAMVSDHNQISQTDNNTDAQPIATNYDFDHPIATDSPSDVNTTELSDYLSHDKSLVKEIIFVDGNVTDYAELLKGVDLTKLVSGELEIKILDTHASGVDQIADYLAQFNNQIEAVHIVSHGNIGELQLGSDIVNNASLNDYKIDLAQWDNGLADNADVLFYGCKVAEGAAGQQFVADLHEIIHADIAASNNLTGSANLGGDWNFEINYGVITTNVAFNTHAQNFYQDVLVTYTVTNTNNSGAGSLRDAIAQSNASTTVDDTIIFDNSLAGQQIALSTAITITDTVTIDGTTLTGYVAPATPTDPAAVTSGNDVGNTGGIMGSTINSGNTANIKINITGFGLSFSAGSDGSILKGVEMSGTADAIGIGANNITIRDSYFHNDTGTLFAVANNSTNILIFNNLIANNNNIVVHQVGDVTLTHNTIHDQVSVGTHGTGAVGNYYYNEIYNTSGTTAISYSFASSGGTIQGNNMHHNVTAVTSVMQNAATHLNVKENLIHDNTGDALNSRGPIENNRIYNNGGRGILTNNSFANNITGNAIYDNTGLAIDVGIDGNTQHPGTSDGRTLNDLNDATVTAQNFPVITSAVLLDANTIRVTGTLNSQASTGYKLEFFLDDNLSNTQAQYYLGTFNVTTGSSSPYTASFTQDIVFGSSVALVNATEYKITATATKISTGRTSELSDGVLINRAPVITNGPDTASTSEDTLSATGTLTVTDGDGTQNVTATVDSLTVISGNTNGLSNATLKAMLGISPSAILTSPQTTNTLNWNFSANAGQFDYLAVGESVVLEYVVKVQDNSSSNAFDTEKVTITINGANDNPTITSSGTTSFNLTENSNVTANGNVSISDLDNTNIVNASATANVNGGTYTGTFNGAGLLHLPANPIINANSNGTLAWTFNPNSVEQFDFLGAGETLILNYTVTFTDSSGGTVSQNLQFTVNGLAEPAPVNTILATTIPSNSSSSTSSTTAESANSSSSSSSSGTSGTSSTGNAQSAQPAAAEAQPAASANSAPQAAPENSGAQSVNGESATPAEAQAAQEAAAAQQTESSSQSTSDSSTETTQESASSSNTNSSSSSAKSSSTAANDSSSNSNASNSGPVENTTVVNQVLANVIGGTVQTVEKVSEQVAIIVNQNPVGAVATAGAGSVASGAIYAAASHGLAMSGAASTAAAQAAAQAAATGMQSAAANMAQTALHQGAHVARMGGGAMKASGAANPAKHKELNRGRDFDLGDKCLCELCIGARASIGKKLLKIKGG